MDIVNGLLGLFASKSGAELQGSRPVQRYSDAHMKGTGYSVEAEVCEALADLMLMLSSMPISGDSERARWLDSLSDGFFRVKAKKAVSEAFLSGDCIVVPAWNGRNMQSFVASSDEFEVLGSAGDELTGVAYVVDTCERRNETYRLLQMVELVPYATVSGEEAIANRYRMAIARGDSIVGASPDEFPQWRGLYEREWYVPNVDRLLVARYKSFAIDPERPNLVKGVPICYGAGEHIRELHYLIDQLHNEYDMSEKAIMAPRRFFKKEDRKGIMQAVMPKGRERLYVEMADAGDGAISEWAPPIRNAEYLEGIDKVERMIERAIGVSSGILSSPNDVNYQNMDNVRKSQQKTMGFVSTARRVAEGFLTDLVRAWDVLADYHGITPPGEYDVSFDWSDEYIETFADRQQAILAGDAIGATDAVDYRMFVMDESPETARERVAQIAEARSVEPVA